MTGIQKTGYQHWHWNEEDKDTQREVRLADPEHVELSPSHMPHQSSTSGLFVMPEHPTHLRFFPKQTLHRSLTPPGAQNVSNKTADIKDTQSCRLTLM